MGNMYSICHAIDQEFKNENYIGCMSYYASLIESAIEFKIAYRQYSEEDSTEIDIEKVPIAKGFKIQVDNDTGKYFCLSRG
jgi:hypothetical protein